MWESISMYTRIYSVCSFFRLCVCNVLIAIRWNVTLCELIYTVWIGFKNNMCFFGGHFYPHPPRSDPIWQAYFSKGLNPPRVFLCWGHVNTSWTKTYRSVNASHVFEDFCVSRFLQPRGRDRCVCLASFQRLTIWAVGTKQSDLTIA